MSDVEVESLLYFYNDQLIKTVETCNKWCPKNIDKRNKKRSIT